MPFAGYLQQLLRNPPLDLASYIGFEQDLAPPEPIRQIPPARAPRRQTGEPDRERRPGEEQIGGGAQEVPAERVPVQREASRQAEMPVDKRIDVLAAACGIPPCGIAHNRAGKLLLLHPASSSCCTLPDIAFYPSTVSAASPRLFETIS